MTKINKAIPVTLDTHYTIIRYGALYETLIMLKEYISNEDFEMQLLQPLCRLKAEVIC